MFMQSPPSRGAWIEIILETQGCYLPKSPPSRGAWIEMDASRLCPPTTASPPSRGAWIEIGFPLRFYWKP